MLPTIGKYMSKFRHTLNAEEKVGRFVDDVVSQFKYIDREIASMWPLTYHEMTLSLAIEYWKACLGNARTSVIEKIKVYYTEDTLWGAYNAINSYYNFDYGRTEENRLKSLFQGTKINKCLIEAMKIVQSEPNFMNAER